MAKNSISDYDTTAANNTDIQSTDISEGCPASGINNAIREMMADTAAAFTQGTPIKLDQTNNRVGVGTTSPSTKIHLNESGSANAVQRIQAGVNGYAAQLHLIGNNVGGSAYNAIQSFVNADSTPQWEITGPEASAEDQMLLHTGGSERMRIDSSGNVGIGAAPNATFGSTLYVQDTPAANKPILSVYSQGNSNNAGIAILNDTGNRGIWTEGSNMRFTRTYEGNSTADMTIDSSGNITIGPSTTTFRGTPGAGANGADIRADDSGGGRIRLSRSGTDGATMISFINTNGEVGGIDTSGTSTAYNTSSDARLKENVADMTGAIDRVKALAPKRFNFIADADTTLDGFLAHEAQAVVPEAVTGTHNEVKTWTQQEIDDGDAPDGTSAGDNKLDGDGNTIPVMQGIDQSKLVPLLTAALKESIAKIETLETEMTALKARVTALEDA